MLDHALAQLVGQDAARGAEVRLVQGRAVARR
jgi:hypothetical protein